MEDFAIYILNEEDYIQKMIIAYYMSKKTGIYFDKSIVLRAEIARMFMNYASLDVDKNQVITAMLLCNCKKVDNLQKIGKLETYAKEGAEYLSSLGFDKDFCTICEGVNRFSGLKRRKKESDVLELVDQFTGLILKRAERDAFTPEEALIVLKERNLKNVTNRYLEDFTIFVKSMENVTIRDIVDVPVLRKLAFLAEREKDTKSYIAKLGNKYSKEIDKLMKVEIKREAERLLYSNIQSTENVVRLNATKTSEQTSNAIEESNIRTNKSNLKEKSSANIISKSSNSLNTISKATQNAKNKIKIVHRYTRKIIKPNPNRALFSQEATERIMNHDTSYRFD